MPLNQPLVSEAIALATGYLNKRELTRNDADWLRALMQHGDNPAHWTPGEPYCISAALAIWNTVLIKHGLKLPFLPSASTQLCYHDAQNADYVAQTPTTGDIVIFRLGDTAHGHAGIVTSVDPTEIKTIEFNTSSNGMGSQRDGGGCYEKVRQFHQFQKSSAHLWIRGYITMSHLDAPSLPSGQSA